MRTLDDSLKQLVYDDRHKEWLLKLAQAMREANETEQPDFSAKDLGVPLEYQMTDTEEHTIWLLLMGMFGVWTICVNYAWIEKDELIPCAEYIEKICEEEL